MHLSTDQAIYLMYLFKMSLRKMKDHRVIPCSVLNEISKKIDNNLQLLWKNRGKYPGFKAAVTSILKDRFGENSNEVAEKLERIIVSELRDLSEYFENQKTINIRDLKLKNALTILEKQKNKIEILSRFDLSPRQMENVLEIIAENGLKTIKKNPYVLLEKYTYGQVEHWNWEESDSGIDLYNLDIALLPDLNYANWFFEEFDPKSPQRIRAIISKILLSTALNEGDTYLPRSEIIERIKDYPLYYTGRELRIGKAELEIFEKDPIFKEKFIIEKEPGSNETIYQLKALRTIEDRIEKVKVYKLR